MLNPLGRLNLGVDFCCRGRYVHVNIRAAEAMLYVDQRPKGRSAYLQQQRGLLGTSWSHRRGCQDLSAQGSFREQDRASLPAVNATGDRSATFS
jgi:hypothetical protein